MSISRLLDTQKFSLSSYLEDLADVYSGVVGGEWLKRRIQAGKSDNVSKRIEHLKKLSLVCPDDFKQISKEDISIFLQFSLDAFAIEIARSNQNNDSTKVFGRKKYIRGRASGDRAAEWYFEMLIQGWYQEVSDVINLDSDSLGLFKKYESRADFMISHAKGLDKFCLVECKKISPYPPTLLDEGLDMGKLKRKIVERIKTIALPQLVASRSALSKRYDIRKCHVLLDVTSYRESSSFLLTDNQRDDSHAYGFSKHYIDDLVKYLKNERFVGLDRLTICWANFLVIGGYPRAMVHNAIHIDYSFDDNGLEKYKGWTIEMHPICSLEGIKEIRISRVARDWDWVVTTYNNLSDPSTFSKAVSLERWGD